MNKHATCKISRLSERESGVALVAVLAMLMSVSLLVLSMVIYSHLANYGVRNDAEILRSRYVAEGAMNRVIWLVAADNYVYNTTDLVNFDYSEYEEDEERFLPDGRLRELDYYGVTVKYRIENGMGGISIDSNIDTALTQLTRVRAVDEEDMSEALTIFKNRYRDYIDTDDNVNVDGMEHEDYEELDEYTQLPRNENIYYREELWFIPDGIKFFPPDRNGRLTMINPLGMGGNRRSKPDLLQAGYSLLTNYSNLSHEDAMETLRVIREFKNAPAGEIPILGEEFDPLLLANLRNYYTIANSGCYRITIEKASAGNTPSVRMDATLFDPGIETDAEFSIPFYDWLIY